MRSYKAVYGLVAIVFRLRLLGSGLRVESLGFGR